MKKKAILAGIAAITGVSGFYGYSAATAGSGLSGRGMENASILSDPEVTVGYAKTCAPRKDVDCARSPYEVHKESDDYDDPDPDLEDFWP